MLLLIITSYSWNILPPPLSPNPGSSEQCFQYLLPPGEGCYYRNEKKKMSQCSVYKFQNRALDLIVGKKNRLRKKRFFESQKHGVCVPIAEVDDISAQYW